MTPMTRRKAKIGRKRALQRAVHSGKTPRIESWSVVEERRIFDLREPLSSRGFAEEVHREVNRGIGVRAQIVVGAGFHHDGFVGFLTPVNGQKQG
jgi:hypothetical protein